MNVARAAPEFGQATLGKAAALIPYSQSLADTPASGNFERLQPVAVINPRNTPLHDFNFSPTTANELSMIDDHSQATIAPSTRSALNAVSSETTVIPSTHAALMVPVFFELVTFRQPLVVHNMTTAKLAQVCAAADSKLDRELIGNAKELSVLQKLGCGKFANHSA